MTFIRFKQKIARFNTLRNQILTIYIFVMTLVLLFVGIITFHIVSSLLKKNAEEQIQQTIIQVNGRLESLYKQLNSLTAQIVTDMYVQRAFSKEIQGERLMFEERQYLMQVVNSYQTYFDGVQSFELYTNDYKRVFPLNEMNLVERVGSQWVEEIKNQRGKMIWIGKDPTSSRFFVVARQVRLTDHSFSPGGYLLVRIHSDYFQLDDLSDQKVENPSYTVVIDERNQKIFSNLPSHLASILDGGGKEEKNYMVVKQASPLTKWKVIIVTPLESLIKGTDILKNAIILSGALGFVIFFIFSFFLSTIVAQPILKLTKIMQRGRNGKLKLSPPISSTIEIDELIETYNSLVNDINHLIQVVYEKELIRSQAELKALQAQINPHFLFNTLDTLYWSLIEKNEEELAKFVLNMAELFRYTISHSTQDEWVTIREEMEHIQRYMEVMKARWGERFVWEIDVSNHCLHVHIPKLLIQPLVENAVLHGIGNKTGIGTVWIIIKECVDGKELLVQVKDDGNGMDEKQLRLLKEKLGKRTISSMKGSGIALMNVNRRLQLYYGEDRELRIESEAGKGTCVSFQIPKSR
ncbi:sensor histidine kinase [Anoxybacillus sp. LAT_35]|uniref:sensor histidine kinase n=1 Tax=unclassified Anoxybacillus TaxID=2639704 RepID=UPI001EDAC4BF|nr:MULTISPECIES: sensor histidine kinase [unclassified Anoxybacillus]MCG5024187.1 sensor histidine kinase [Anoxybacillus flavithermus]MCG3086117.1 sensor histidine kinase [Anoxybacillus sp. LAT27]MCG6172911.1 sensor histidine kinase [Anoxybacillus sp. LAT_11]MCG6173541.1 sensor histidine kinase [Anoxybacillus sp. LAT_11]MCG6173897.1 sensor histidine kinase [Anoxybacillus sp. LAT_31]